MKSAAFIMLLVIGIAQEAITQTRHELSLDSAIAIAVRNGYAASSVKARYLSAKKNAESARRSLWTSVSLSLNVPSYEESLTQQFNPYTGLYEYYHLQYTNLQSALTINQPLVFSGGNLRFTQGILGRNQTTGMTGSTTHWKDFFSSFSFELTQPILTPNVSGITQTANEIALEQAESDFLADQMTLVYNVTATFYTVYQIARRVDIAKEQVAQNEESYETSRRKYESGLIPEVDVLQSEVDLSSSRNELLNTQQELGQAKNSLRLLLGIPSEEDVATVGEIEYHAVELDSSIAVQSALQKRTEVLAAQRRITLAKGDIGMAKSRNDFRFDLTARYGVDRNDTVFKNLFHDFNQSKSASLTISLPIFDWGSNSLGVEAAEVQHKNATEAADYTRQQVGQEVIDLLNRTRVAASRIQVLEKSVDVAQKGYDQSLQRFRNGTITRNDLTLAQQRLTNAKTNILSALVDYKLGLADLRRRTLWDFEMNGPAKPCMEAGGE